MTEEQRWFEFFNYVDDKYPLIEGEKASDYLNADFLDLLYCEYNYLKAQGRL